MLFIMVLICSIAVGCDGQLLHHWSYQMKGKLGPQNWCEKVSDTCCGSKQSPIYINNKNVKYTHHSLEISNLDRICEKMTIYNNGHTVQLTVNSTTNIPRLTLRSGVDNDYLPNILNFTFHDLHFHFGSNDSFGSEHIIDSQPSSPMEITTYTNVLLKPMIEELPWIAFQEKHRNIKPFPLKYFFPKDVDQHYSYKGSVTTPPCEETVTWFIMKNRLPISPIQMMRFRQLTKNGLSAKTGLNGPQHNGEGANFIFPNVRPLQPLNERVIYDNISKRNSQPLKDFNAAEMAVKVSGAFLQNAL